MNRRTTQPTRNRSVLRKFHGAPSQSTLETRGSRAAKGGLARCPRSMHRRFRFRAERPGRGTLRLNWRIVGFGPTGHSRAGEDLRVGKHTMLRRFSGIQSDEHHCDRDSRFEAGQSRRKIMRSRDSHPPNQTRSAARAIDMISTTPVIVMNGCTDAS
jgi:hypothetical protein